MRYACYGNSVIVYVVAYHTPHMHETCAENPESQKLPIF